MACSRTSSSLGTRTLSLVVFAALVIPTQPALATHVTTAANIPNSGIAPGHVNMATGELILVMRPDLALDGPIPLVFQRYYASMLAREGLASGKVGTNWLSNYDWSLTVAPPNATVVTDRGQRIQFLQSIASGGWNLVSPTDQKYRLDAISGGNFLLTHPGNRRLYGFNGTTGQLTQIIDEHGNGLNLNYSGGLLSQVTDGLGRFLIFGYSGGLLTTVSDGTRSVIFGHTGSTLNSVTDATSLLSTYTYAVPSAFPGLLTSVIEPVGNSPFTYSYDPSGRVATRADALSHTFTYTYDLPVGNRFTDALANAWTYSHDALDRLQALIDPNTGSTTFTYDPFGRLASFHRPLGDSTSFTYDAASGYPRFVTRSDGLSYGYQYTAHSVSASSFFDVRVASFPDATSEIYDRDAAGNVMTFTDREGFPWQATYNPRGQLLTWTNPTGGMTTFTYDPQGRPDSRRDNAGNTSHYTFDSFSRLTQIGWPDGPTRLFAYNNVDQVTTFTDERSKIWSYGYDDNHRLIVETDPLLHNVQRNWNANDQVTQVVDPLIHPTLYGYDADNRLSSITDRTSRTITFNYDGLHRLTGIVNAASDTWSNSYDPNSRLTSWQDPLGHGVIFGHDFLDRVTHVTDPVLSPFDFGYDTMGRLLTVTAPLAQNDVMAYDRRGLLTSYRHVTPQTDLQRTPLGEVSVLTDPNRFRWLADYDPQGRPQDDADPLGRSATYFYDARSRLALADLPVVGGVNYTYDPTSRLTECQWLDGTTLTYSYDDANRITGGTGASFAYDPAGRMTSSNGLSMGYDFEGRITSETYASGKVVSYTYDNRGLLTAMSDWVGGTTTFTYDTAERLTGMTRPNGTSVAYTYDAADRLISAVEAQPGPIQISAITMTRDELGRPATIARRQPLMPAVTLPASSGFSYDPASQITGLSWDGLARLTSDGTRLFVWDNASRLTHFVAGADSPSFTYDAYDRMLSRSLGASAEQYVWNYAHDVPTLDAVYQGPTARKFYVYTPGGTLLYSVDAATGARRFYHYDENGNTIFLTSETGSVTTEYAYTPFGGVSSLGETAGNPFTWGAAAGMIQLGAAGGIFSKYGSTVYESTLMRVISGGAVNSGTQPGPVQSQPGPTQIGTQPGPISSPLSWLMFSTPSVYTTKIDWSGPGDEGPEESITFVYGRLGVKYIPYETADGGDASEAQLGSPCAICPRPPTVLSTPKFSKISSIFFALPASEPSLTHPAKPLTSVDPLAPSLASSLLGISDPYHDYYEEEKNSHPHVKLPQPPGIGDPFDSLTPKPIMIWRFTDPPTGTDSMDPRYLIDYVMPIMTPCAACP